MTEIDEEVVAVETGDTTLLYDYFKHLTSLCIVSLGGVLALVPNAKAFPHGLIAAVLVVLSGAALMSFTGAAEIVRARFKDLPLGKSVNFYRVTAPVLLSVGVGMFVYLFTWTLK